MTTDSSPLSRPRSRALPAPGPSTILVRLECPCCQSIWQSEAEEDVLGYVPWRAECPEGCYDGPFPALGITVHDD